MISTLTNAGVHEIKGTIIIDDTAFDNVALSPGSAWDDTKFCYDSPISAININHNCIYATLSPAMNLMQPATLTLPAQPQFIQLLNTVITSTKTQEECPLDLEQTNDTTFTLTGCIKQDDKPIELKMAIKDPRTYLQTALIYILNKHQFKFLPNFEYKSVSPTSKLLASENSAPLNNLLTTMLKDSDNTIADSIFKTTGAHYFHAQGTWRNGSRAAHEILSKNLSVNFAKKTLIDGAGGSVYDYFTPQQIVTLLQKVYSDKNEIFMAALPISGIDGTLKERMKSAEVLGKIRAKTGTSSGITTLSGYAETKRQQTVIFSIMINGFVDAPAKYKVLEDAICAELVKI